ncbi:MAG TPA: hypothetical protein VHY82_16175 [Acetobacteraceae bacterium]|nr:hypothetical protein [Acetobacteraceae bacterium]
MKRRLIPLAACGLLIAAAAPGPRDPDWPCQQIKVPHLSWAAVWSGPAPDEQHGDWRDDSQLADLVQSMAQRRVPVDQMQAQIRAFAAQAGDQKAPKLLLALSAVFGLLDDERSSVIDGLDRFGGRQKELAAALRQDTEKLRAMQADSSADAGEVDQIEQRVTWEGRVFQDRRQALSYACDVPAKIEQRLFAIARAVQEVLE